MFKKVFSGLLAAGLLTLTACGGAGQTPAPNNAAGTEQPAADSQAAPKEPVKMSIMLDWYPNAVHSFLYTAQEKGYFKDQGIDLDIKMPADTNDPLKLVAAGDVDFALSYQPQVVMARAESIPVVSVAAVVRHPLDVLMVPKSGPVKSPKELAGKSVGYPAIPMNEALVKTMVKTDGGDPDKVKLVDVGWDIMPALSTKKVDAVSGGYINHEQLLLEKHGFPVTGFKPVDYGVPDYYELVLVTSEKTMKEKPDLVKAFREACSKGFADVQQDPSAGLDLLLKKQDKTFPLEKDIETKSLDILLPLMASDKEPFGAQTLDSWKNVISWMKDTKLITKDVDAEKCFVK